MSVELSVVILCYKSENYITTFVAQIQNELESMAIDYELILVANYNDLLDTTPQIAHDLSANNPSITVVAKKKEGKMGWDMRSGLRSATGKYIAMIDGDGQMPVSDIGTVYTIIKTGKYDLVKTFRAFRFDGLYRRVISQIYNRLFKILFHPNFPLNDVNSKPKILTREAYEKLDLISNDWFTDAEIMIQVIKNKMRICQISTIFYRNERRLTFIDFSTVFEFIYNLFYYRFKR